MGNERVRTQCGWPELGEDDDVSPLLAVLVGQLEFANRFGVEPAQSNLWDRVVLEEGCLGEKRVYVERSLGRRGQIPAGLLEWRNGRSERGHRL
ncbi:hypothetical protein D7X32_41375 [Corallococcus carmarthensis]|uniref:Uncharacterized protein n=1 Tax=Corallococcus carmarthensis TaxID=2316728 RepID=A0A3A8JG04_9BACT|nr:hypothetical protein D7X32_41375 [Corallococcus carmarthensis]